MLDRTPPIGCDAVGVDYTSATIRIDPASDPDVWAETDAAKKLAVKWTDGFTATDGSPPTIVGPKGEEVAHDGTKIDVPRRRLPEAGRVLRLPRAGRAVRPRDRSAVVGWTANLARS